jgi:hypothetical protein
MRSRPAPESVLPTPHRASHSCGVQAGEKGPPPRFCADFLRSKKPDRSTPFKNTEPFMRCTTGSVRCPSANSPPLLPPRPEVELIAGWVHQDRRERPRAPAETIMGEISSARQPAYGIHANNSGRAKAVHMQGCRRAQLTRTCRASFTSCTAHAPLPRTYVHASRPALQRTATTHGCLCSVAPLLLPSVGHRCFNFPVRVYFKITIAGLCNGYFQIDHSSKSKRTQLTLPDSEKGPPLI